jgi:L-threonylcarbamoyladenylate synthase
LKKRPVELLVDSEGNDLLTDILTRAIICLQHGGIVAFPTETYYGLAVDPFNEKALQALFRLKERDPQKPILVLISEVDQLEKIAEYIPAPYQSLINNFWPGPLTLIFPGRKNLSPLLTGGTGTVGVRISSNNIANKFCQRWGNPITATSANISGMTPAVSAHEVHTIFGSQVDYIIDGGHAPVRRCSTIVGMSHGCLQLLREGQIDFRSVLQSLCHNVEGG